MEQFTKKQSYNEKYSEIMERHERMASSIIEKVLNQGEDHENFLGDGQTAKVFIFGVNQSTALKIVNADTLKPGNTQEYVMNSLAEEARIANIVGNIKDPYVTVPEQFFSATFTGEDKKRTSLLFMEAIKGPSVKNCFDDKKFPENFNPIEFSDKLYDFVEKMNKVGIHHRDLHAGNILINPENLNPIIIDFGLATDEDLDQPYFVQTPVGIQPYASDKQRIRELKKELTTLLL
jgi:tRNA A-37 threonylcarbamoyl transferase component Bud32